MAGFGERPGETDREQSRHGAPGRLSQRVIGTRSSGPAGPAALPARAAVPPATVLTRTLGPLFLGRICPRRRVLTSVGMHPPGRIAHAVRGRKTLQQRRRKTCLSHATITH